MGRVVGSSSFALSVASNAGGGGGGGGGRRGEEGGGGGGGNAYSVEQVAEQKVVGAGTTGALHHQHVSFPCVLGKQDRSILPHSGCIKQY